MRKIKPVLRVIRRNVYFLIFFVFLLIFTKTHIGSYNDASRMATIESLVERKTFAIDNSTYNWTGDKVYIKGHFYSDKLPVLSFLASGPYLFLKKLGFSFQTNESLVIYVLTFLFSGVPALMLLFFFGKTLDQISIKAELRSKLLISLGFGTILLPWSTVFNNHVITASLLFIAFYFLLKSNLHKPSPLSIILAGLLSSMAMVIDVPVGMIFFLCFLLYIFLSFPKKCVLFYLLASIPFLLLHSILNYQIAKTVIPVTFYPQYFFYKGSEWKLEQLSGFAKHSPSSLAVYAFHSLTGFRGLFSYNPILLLFPFALIKFKRVKTLRKEAILLSIAIVTTLSFFILKTSNYGGFSYGVRWFLPLIPFMLFVGALALKEKFPYFLPLFIISFLISAIGIINPWTNVTLGSVPIINNLLEAMKWFR